MDSPEILNEMVEYYNQRAPIYDESMGYNNPAVVAQHAILLQLLEACFRGRDVLEVACGPGYWTRAVSSFASSIVAIDANESVLHEARKKEYPRQNVRFLIADAYSPDPVEGRFDGAYAVDWWSHIPKSKRTAFLDTLHGKLNPGAPVVFIDTLPRTDRVTDHYDEEGNHYQRRDLPSGDKFVIIKNYPDEGELRDLFFSGRYQGVEFRRLPEIRRWFIKYRLGENR